MHSQTCMDHNQSHKYLVMIANGQTGIFKMKHFQKKTLFQYLGQPKIEHVAIFWDGESIIKSYSLVPMRYFRASSRYNWNHDGENLHKKSN